MTIATHNLETEVTKQAKRGGRRANQTGRPKTLTDGKTVAVVLEAGQHETIRAIAEQSDRSISEVVRHLLGIGLALDKHGGTG